MPDRRSLRSFRHWPPPVNVMRYGLAVLSWGAAVLLMHGIERLSGADARPALLVAVAISALYGGIGPGLLALGLTALVSREPGVLITGALLVGVCALFRRSPAVRREIPASTGPEKGPIRSPSQLERPRAAPGLLEVTTEATWRFHHEQPLDITLPEDDQVEHLYLYSVLAECNDAFARMYGFRSAADVVGTRLVVFVPPSNPENLAYLRTFIRSGYRLEDAESREIDRYGNEKCFVNNLVGIFERGQLVGAWGTQRDVTGLQRSGSQENRSRIHSTKTSSQ